MKTKQTLVAGFLLLCATSIFAQWVKQNLPATIGTPHMDYPGLNRGAIGKNFMLMLTRNYNGDTNQLGAVQAVRTTDGGRTYRLSQLPFNMTDYFYNPQLVDARTAYVVSSHWETGANAIHRSVDSGATWQTLAYSPPTFLNTAIFYDQNNGFIICDPDSIGAFIAYTTNSGESFTRLPRSNVPSTRAQEVFLGGFAQVIGDVTLQPSIDNETGMYRIWRSMDRGRNWTASPWQEEHSPFGANLIFTDAQNGLWISGSLTPQITAFYTHDGGNTWLPSGALPGDPSGGPIGYVPNTQQIVAIFQDTTRRMLFSAISNDLGKTWNSKKDLAPYRLDSVYTQFGLPAFAWTNIDIVDNNTAWAKFSRHDFYRYNSSTPIVPEKPDLDLELKADNDGLPLYGSVKYTLTVRNRGISPATGVKINWLPPYKRTNNGVGPYAYQAAYSDKGSYDSWNGVWTIDKLDAGATATATFHLFVLNNTQNVTQTAQVAACNESDLDSSPNNMTATAKEDDEVGFVARAINSTAEMPNAAFRGKTPDFAVSPNPAKDKINVAINADMDAQWSIRVLNSLGQTVYSRSGQNVQIVDIDVKRFDTGLYLVEYQSNGERKVEKIMIEH